MSAHVWVCRRGSAHVRVCRRGRVPHASGVSTRMWINTDASHT